MYHDRQKEQRYASRLTILGCGCKKGDRMQGYFRPIEAIKPEDIGLGAFYYFASVAIIQVMNYVGYGRTPEELMVFFAITVISMVALHVAVAVAHGLCDMVAHYVEPSIGVAAVSAILSICLSMLEPFGLLFFYASALLTGLACAMTTIGLTDTLSFKLLRPSSFCIPVALLVAVGFYFIYRVFGLFSIIVANGWLMSVPLIGMVALLITYVPDFSTSEFERPEKRSFMLLGITAAVFAVGCGLLVYFSGYPGSTDRAAFTFTIPLEAVGALAITGICVCLFRLAEKRRSLTPLLSAAVVAAMVFPSFALGILTGMVEVPGGQTGFLWEASIWVLLVAVFAYDMRTSLYAIKGIAIGPIFEAWCMGQMLTKIVVLHDGGPLVLGGAIILGALYIASVFSQVLMWRRPLPSELSEPFRAVQPLDPLELCADGELQRVALEASSGHTDDPRQAPCPDVPGHADESQQQACLLLGRQHSLTARETEVLCLIAKGRTARFIADELVISYNTARSHVRHVYEKLDIHSKQEIISLIESIRQEEN